MLPPRRIASPCTGREEGLPGPCSYLGSARRSGLLHDGRRDGGESDAYEVSGQFGHWILVGRGAGAVRDVNGAPFPANPWGIHLLGDGYGEL
jgi:hypothetical protein